MPTEIERLKEMIDRSKNIVVFTGAGMSTESGIPDFRSAGGIWEDDATRGKITESYLRYKLKEFWPTFKQLFLNLDFIDAQPNVGHQLVARLEELGKNVTVVTQNVDGLHQAAGSTRVIEVHGTIKTFRCPRKKHDTVYDLAYVMANDLPRCTHMFKSWHKCDLILHPDVIMFDQPVKRYWEAAYAVEECDLLLIMGTSLEPNLLMTGLPKHAPGKADIAIINLTPTHLDEHVELVIHCKIGEVLSQVIKGE